jgi:CheY-like chemotaxis protein
MDMPRILIIDDDELFRSMLRAILTKMGHAVRDANDCDEAVNRFEEEPAEILITDLVMPGKDGLQVIALFKSRFPAVKIVAMSGAGRLVQTTYLKRATAAGADAVIEKPFTKEQLAEVLAQCTVSFPRNAPDEPQRT